MVGAGAKVLGPFTVGKDAKIGSNAVVTKPVPAGVTALESCFSQPYYEFLQRDVPAIFFGEGSFKRLYERLTSKLNGKKEITTDWRHFDKLAPNFIIDEAWELIRSSFTENFAGHVTITGEVNDKDGDPGWNRIFNFMVSYFKYTRVMLPDGSVLKKLLQIKYLLKLLNLRWMLLAKTLLNWQKT